LIHKGKEYQEPKAIPQVYHDLKSFSHIPITIYMLFKNSLFTLTEDGTLKKYFEQLNQLTIPDSIDATERKHIDRIITASKILLEKEINNNGSVHLNEVKQFCEDLCDDLTALLNAAAMAQLEQMHNIVQGWMKEHHIDPRDSSFYVLIISARTARLNNIQTTYFEHLLGDERKRCIAYIEELFDNEEKAISIFSTWFLDEQLSVTFFKDEDRMHRDLLMNDYVHQQIKKFFS
jgi:hypothetical protein